MKVLVTGGLGFVGSHLVDHLCDLGHEVFVWDNLCTESASEGYMREDVAYTKKDVRDICDDEHPDYEVIYHLAAYARIQPSFEMPFEYLSNDIMGTAAICELARKLGSRVVYAGSSSAYGGPMLNPYAFAKYTGEQVCQLYHEVYQMSTVVARFFNVYGARQPTTGKWATVVGIFEEQTKNNKSLTITGDGDQRRDFTHVQDIVAGFASLGDKSWQEKPKMLVFNIGTGENHSINELADMFGGEKSYISSRPGEARNTLADNSMLKKHTDWKASTLITEYVQSFINSVKKK